MMKTIKELHAELVGQGNTSLEAAEILSGMMNRSVSTIYGWIGKREPNKELVELANIKLKKD